MHRLIALFSSLSIVTAIGVAHASKEDVRKPDSIKIEGDNAIFDQASSTITYAGSVQAVQGELKMSGDKLVVMLTDKEADTIHTTGSPARLSLQQPSGNNVSADPLRASANSIVFNPSTQQLELTGSATLQQGGNTIRSELIRYDVAARQIRAEGMQDRVRMEFNVTESSLRLMALWIQRIDDYFIAARPQSTKTLSR